MGSWLLYKQYNTNNNTNTALTDILYGMALILFSSRKDYKQQLPLVVMLDITNGAK